MRTNTVKGTDAMTITNIRGVAEADRQAAAALAALLMMWKHGDTDTLFATDAAMLRGDSARGGPVPHTLECRRTKRPSGIR